MAIKTVKLPEFATLTGMYAFLYNPATGALINTGGDALTLKSLSDANAGLFEFDVTESLTAYDWVQVAVHSSATASTANLLWWGCLEKAKDECQDSVTPLADHYAGTWVGYILSWLVGAISNAQTATETTQITVNGRTFTVALSGATETGNRGTPTLTET